MEKEKMRNEKMGILKVRHSERLHLEYISL